MDGLIRKDKLLGILGDMWKKAWSISAECAVIEEIQARVNRMDELESTAPCVKRIEFATWDFVGWTSTGSKSLYRCSHCGWEVDHANFMWCPVCGHLNDPDEKKKLQLAQMRFKEARKKDKPFLQKPLSKDELARAVGCPVYCEEYRWSDDPNHKYTDQWAILSDVEFSNGQLSDITCGMGDWELYSYGWQNDRGWRAWRKVPTERERAAAKWEG